MLTDWATYIFAADNYLVGLGEDHHGGGAGVHPAAGLRGWHALHAVCARLPLQRPINTRP